MRVFLAAPAHRGDDLSRLAQVAEVVRAAGHEPVLPHEDAPLARLAGCDAVVALLDGADADASVAFALGFGRSRGLVCLGLRNDPRPPVGGVDSGVFADGLTAFAQGDWEELESALFGFLTHPAPREVEMLVRDRVPTRLRQDGVAFELRRAEGGARASALKQRLVTEAERLLAAVEGDEREPMAEVLELVETLLELRHYDPASLRRAKERLEAEDGGYEQGYLVKSGSR